MGKRKTPEVPEDPFNELRHAFQERRQYEDLERAVKLARRLIKQHTAALFRLHSERIISIWQDEREILFPLDFLRSRVAPFLKKPPLVPSRFATGKYFKDFSSSRRSTSNEAPIAPGLSLIMCSTTCAGLQGIQQWSILLMRFLRLIREQRFGTCPHHSSLSHVTFPQYLWPCLEESSTHKNWNVALDHSPDFEI